MSIEDMVKDFRERLTGPHDFVQTSPCGAGQRHPHGLVGGLWKIKTPESVKTGHCFMRDRLKEGDLWLGIAHTGDCFQTYMYVEDYANCFVGRPKWTFGSYGIGDSEEVDLPEGGPDLLKAGERVLKEEWHKKNGMEKWYENRG